jgi:hypothetical protein
VQRITARAVAFRRDEELATECLVFAEHADGGGRTVELQLGLAETEEDRRSGLSGYCVVIDGGPCAFRCVDGWKVAVRELTLEFSAVAAREFGARSLLVRFPTGAVSAVRHAVEHLIDGRAVPDEFTIIDAP